VETTATDILIIGAGFAGAATAFHLSRMTDQSIILAEKESLPGFHASGRNASLLMQSAENREIRRLIIAGRAAYAAAGAAAISPPGSYLLGSREQLEALREDRLPSEFRDPQRLRHVIPLLDGHQFESALFTPSDGVVDIAGLLHFYLAGARERGARLLTDCRVEAIQTDAGFLITTSVGQIQARYVINAAGAWAPEIASLAGAAAMPLTPLKRHLFVLGELGSIPHDWPFVWNLARNFYFRPESDDLLFSLCDEQLCASLEPTVEKEISEDLAALIWRELPALANAVLKKVWSCFRTKTPDGNFLIGWDPELEGFFWVAGLGGHGMGASWETGRLAAQVFAGHSHREANPFDPARFAKRLTAESDRPPRSPLDS
jgi:D-arginine dehydrogenase